MEQEQDEEERQESLEQVYLAAVEKGDLDAVEYALKHKDEINVMAVDNNGRSAMVIALLNGHIEILKLLLKHKIHVGDALLRAVDLDFFKAVEILCESSRFLRRRGIDIINCRSENEDFHQVITPIVLAAHHNNYDIIKILLDHGAHIEDPESACSLGTLLVYRALSSEAFITLTSKDPIDTAFILSGKLRKLSQRDVEFGAEYIELEEQCETFAADLLAQTRNTRETHTILTYNPTEWAKSEKIDAKMPHKAFTAVKYRQKKFVAHPHCQQFLIERWYRGLTDWRERSSFSKIIISSLLMISFPFLSILYLLFPRGQVTKLLQIPYVKFLMHTASSLGFVTLIFLSLLRVEDWTYVGGAYSSTNVLQYFLLQDSLRGKQPSLVETFMFIWVLGMTWREIKELWKKGAVSYSFDSWNIMDFVQLALYWISYTLMMVSWLIWRRKYQELDALNESVGSNSVFEIRRKRMSVMELDSYMQDNTIPDLKSYVDQAITNITGFVADSHNQQFAKLTQTLINNFSCTTSSETATEAPIQFLKDYSSEQFRVESRAGWSGYDPDLVAEAVFAMANIISVLRLINIVVISKQVGPLQISLWKMFYDIVRFLAIFGFVLLAFAVGLTQLYKFYSSLTILECRHEQALSSCYSGFTSLTSTIRALFWTLFGVSALEKLEVTANHPFTEIVGEIAYALYGIAAVIILLNALIAMMSNTYTRIEENSDREWKYSRAQLWMSFFEGGATVPPPFNIIPSVKSIYYRMKSLIYACCPRLQRKRTKKQWDKIADLERRYEEVIQQLVSRYWAEKRSGGHENEKHVSQVDILRLKQDISGLRYEVLSNLHRSDRSIQHIRNFTASIMKSLLDIRSTIAESNREDSAGIVKLQEEMTSNVITNDNILKNAEDEMQIPNSRAVMKMQEKLSHGPTDSLTDASLAKPSMTTVSTQTEGTCVLYDTEEDSMLFNAETDKETSINDDIDEAEAMPRDTVPVEPAALFAEARAPRQPKPFWVHSKLEPSHSSATPSPPQSLQETEGVSPIYALYERLIKD
uniref:Short transient receptor potential channel 4 n=2 Tax=Saccoglossus kowalevskii TaxID=10224 RepID=A0ABM0M9A3_SACKO|nr:PREDICTED: short transient receptor potential channel 4 [Saccoglossus kowalevskii]